MSLGLALNNAIAGLQLNQQALAVLSNNIANVNTPGYSRKSIQQSALYVEGVGQGVKIDDIVRKVDAYLQRSVLTQGSETQRSSTVSDYYDRLQTLLGTPGAGDSIDSYMTGFFNSLDQMASQPDLTSYRSNMVSSAVTLAQQVSGLASQTESLRFQADGDIAASIRDVNSSLSKLFDLNVAISRASVLNQSTAGMLDARDKELQTISQNMDITTSYAPSGAVTVTSTSGVALVDGARHQIVYSPVGSVDNLVNNQRINDIQVSTVDDQGKPIGNPSTLVVGGTEGNVQDSSISGGKIGGLLDLRDNLMPQILDQLDMMASRLRDGVNALHNNGSGFPPATSLTAARTSYGGDTTNWTGSVRIAVLQSDGTPVPGQYADESTTGVRPLTLDLSQLQSPGLVKGKFDVSTLIDEINNHFGIPGPKAEVGPLNNIQLASDTDQLPSGGISTFNFDLDMNNITANPANVFVTGVTVNDSTGATISNSFTKDVPSIAIDPASTYTTSIFSTQVDMTLPAGATKNIKVGDTIYVSPPSTAFVNGIAASDMSGYVKVTNVSGNVVSFDAATQANASGTVGDASGVYIKTAYDTVGAGAQARSTANGQMQVDFSGNVNSAYYDITLNVGVVASDGTVTQSQVSYRVTNNQQHLMNTRYDATAATGGGAKLVQPNTIAPTLVAELVDDNGNLIPKVNGRYLDVPGHLKLVGGNGQQYSIAIDELSSKEMGDASRNPPQPASGWGFSQYFGLNNLFTANDPIPGGDTVKNSAINLKVEQRLIDNPNLVTTGRLELQAQPTDPNVLPQYTYVRYAGDNTAAQAMADLSTATVHFAASGGLPATDISVQSYTSELLGYVSSLSSAAKSTSDNAQSLYDGFNSRAQAVSGVNLDEELANTVILQNAYAATAKVVTVVNDMFKTLMDAF